jgi:hypothetical protein
MKKFILFIICFAFGILIILNYFIWQPIEKTPAPKETKTTQVEKLDPKELIDNPPKNSIKGELTTLEGEVKWQSRAATESAVITELQTIQQGELIETEEDGTAEVSFEDTITASLSKKSSLDFPQTLPDKFMVIQRSGEVLYTNSNNSALSVRSRALISLLKNGSMKITIIEDEPVITIENIKGTIQIAYNDSDLESHVITLTEGEIFSFDTDERTGEIL